MNDSDIQLIIGEASKAANTTASVRAADFGALKRMAEAMAASCALADLDCRVTGVDYEIDGRRTAVNYVLRVQIDERGVTCVHSTGQVREALTKACQSRPAELSAVDYAPASGNFTASVRFQGDSARRAVRLSHKRAPSKQKRAAPEPAIRKPERSHKQSATRAPPSPLRHEPLPEEARTSGSAKWAWWNPLRLVIGERSGPPRMDGEEKQLFEKFKNRHHLFVQS